MKKIIGYVTLLVLVLFLAGCEMRTVDQMYAPPKRSEDENRLQTVINESMSGLEYSAPVSGDNRQTVQTVDLDGDNVDECLLFAKGGDNLPLHILVFAMEEEEYIHAQTIDLPGTAFDKVEYSPMDDHSGMEIVVGTQVSDQISRCVSVFSFSEGEMKQLASENYVNFLTLDLNGNGKHELFMITAGSGYLDRGIVKLFRVREGMTERSAELSLSETTDNLKRIAVGKLSDGRQAVYVSSAVDENTLVTDVFAIVDDSFVNVALAGGTGATVKALRGHYVYAEDIDADGIMELPVLQDMRTIDKSWYGYDEKRISWYSLTGDGQQIGKLSTYHNFAGQWYVELDSDLADRVSVVDLSNAWDFYVWDGGLPIKVMTIYALTGQNREAQSTADGRFVLHRTESTIYAAALDQYSPEYDFTKESVMRSFHVIA